ncbi:MAG: hypothetical protein RLZ97_504 [Verrucomicrobiota bacterium]|jgi:hypothetical protein
MRMPFPKYPLSAALVLGALPGTAAADVLYATGTFFEDAGDGYSDQTGDFRRATFRAQTKNGKVTVTVAKAEGRRPQECPNLSSIWCRRPLHRFTPSRDPIECKPSRCLAK